MPQANTDSLFIKKMSDEIMTNGKAYDLLYELTKKIGGRLAGSPQGTECGDLGKEKFRGDRVQIECFCSLVRCLIGSVEEMILRRLLA
jgi:hypothetical protein